MKRFYPILVLLTLWVGFTPVSAQSPHDLFQQALVKERTDGDLRSAITLYEQVVARSSDRTLSARALVQIGKSYERLGRTEAASAYQRVIRDFPDQGEPVAEARLRLADLRASAVKDRPAEETTNMVAAKIMDIEDTMGRVSPDGKWLSYVDWGTGNVAIQNLETGAKQPVNTDGSWDEPWSFGDVSLWSPDGRQLLYYWIVSSPEEGGRSELRLYDMASGGTSVLLPLRRENKPFPVAWVPDGSKVIAINERRGHQTDAIVLLDAQDGSTTVLESLPDGMHTFVVSVSPDSRYIAYEYFERPSGAENPDVPKDIRIASLDGTYSALLIEHSANDSHPWWSPDGRYVLFVSDRSGAPAIWAVAVEDGRATGQPFIVHTDFSGQPLGMTDDGGFYFAKWLPQANVFVQDVDFATGEIGEDARILSTHLEGMSHAGSISPDGKRLAYGAFVHGGENLVILDLETGRCQELEVAFSRVERSNASTPSWSPDGKLLALMGRRDGRWPLDLVDASTGASIRHISTGPARVTGRGFSPDGKALYYARTDGLHVYDLESDTSTLLRENPDSTAYFVAVSPDGSRYAALEYDTRFSNSSRALKLFSITDGSERILLTLDGPSFSAWVGLAWTPDGEALVYAENLPNRGQQLYVHEVETGLRRPLGRPVFGRDQRQGVQVHPNGLAITFSRHDSRLELWRIDNLLAKK